MTVHYTAIDSEIPPFAHAFERYRLMISLHILQGRPPFGISKQLRGDSMAAPFPELMWRRFQSFWASAKRGLRLRRRYEDARTTLLLLKDTHLPNFSPSFLRLLPLRGEQKVHPRDGAQRLYTSRSVLSTSPKLQRQNRQQRSTQYPNLFLFPALCSSYQDGCATITGSDANAR
jgi:hypothetical protein